MKFTGTLIEDLMATVERAEQRACTTEHSFAALMVVEPWLASLQETSDYDSKFLGVA